MKFKEYYNKLLKEERANHADTLHSLFQATVQINTFVNKYVIAPSGLTKDEASIIHAAYSILTGRSSFQPIYGKYILLDHIVASTTLTQEIHEPAKVTRILISLIKKGLVEVTKYRNFYKARQLYDRAHGNSNCVLLTPKGEELAKALTERLEKLAETLYKNVSEDDLAKQLAINKLISTAGTRPDSGIW